jgi:hypothetical protein
MGSNANGAGDPFPSQVPSLLGAKSPGYPPLDSAEGSKTEPLRVLPPLAGWPYPLRE